MAKKKVTDLQAFVETHGNKIFWIGMDVHKSRFRAAATLFGKKAAFDFYDFINNLA